MCWEEGFRSEAPIREKPEVTIPSGEIERSIGLAESLPNPADTCYTGKASWDWDGS